MNTPKKPKKRKLSTFNFQFSILMVVAMLAGCGKSDPPPPPPDEPPADEPVLTVNTISISFESYDAAPKTFSITSNRAWSVTSGAEWCSVSPTSGDGNATVTVSVTNNAGAESRKASIDITAADAPAKKITITQSAEKVLPSNVYPLPQITPPSEHPRLLLRAQDMPVIKANMGKPQHVNAMTEYTRLLQTKPNAILLPPAAGSGNDNATILGTIEAMAFDYLISNNTENGNAAIKSITDYLSTVVFATGGSVERQMGQTIFTAAEVYDWCYPLLGQSKRSIISACERIAGMMEVTWPPVAQGNIVGHGAEMQIEKDLLSFAIATYNERPDIYNFVAGRYLSEFIRPRDFWYPSHSCHQGIVYGGFRYAAEMWGNWMIFRMSGEKIFTPEAQYPMYQFIYYRTPTNSMLMEGDNLLADLNGFRFSQGAWLASGFYADPYLKYELQKSSSDYNRWIYDNANSMTPVQFMLFNNPDLEPKPHSELPKTKYFGSPNGMMVARTAWSSNIPSNPSAPDVIVQMKIGEYWAADHHHLDAGTFQIFYKGFLTRPLGIYDSYNSSHDLNYGKETVSHNGLLIFDPGETGNINNAKNSGGQKRWGGQPNTMGEWMNEAVYKTGSVTGHTFGPDPVNPEYTYISGDITAAYSSKVSSVQRSMLFAPTGSTDIPAVFAVFDRIVSKDASFKKSFLLQAGKEPVITANTISIKAEGNGTGMLTNQTLYPKDAKIEPVGGVGKQWWINGTNFLPQGTKADDLSQGWGRVEISPVTPSQEDYFLNIMYVSDQSTPFTPAELIETPQLLGARLLDRVILFARGGAPLTTAATVTIPGSGNIKVVLAGIREGAWKVSATGVSVGNFTATKEGGMIYFTVPAGEISVTP